jgi:hypothetical protein
VRSDRPLRNVGRLISGVSMIASSRYRTPAASSLRRAISCRSVGDHHPYVLPRRSDGLVHHEVGGDVEFALEARGIALRVRPHSLRRASSQPYSSR